MDEIYQSGVGPLRRGAEMSVQPSLVHGAINLIATALAELDQANGTLVETRSRLFGPWPSAGQTGDGLKVAPSGQAGDLHELIGRLRQTVDQVRENASALAGAL